MKKFFKWFSLGFFFAVIIVLLFLGYAWNKAFGPGYTKEETAHILVTDLKFGGRAEQKAIKYGDSILPIIQNESSNFENLNGRN